MAPCPTLDWNREKLRVLQPRGQQEEEPLKPVPILNPRKWEATTSRPKVCPNLTSAAPELGALLGWQAAPADELNTVEDHAHVSGLSGQIAIRLHRPRPANCVIVKLIAAHNLRPEYNQQRGGCNIDAGHVGLKGRRLVLPAGCVPAGGRACV